MDEKTVEIAPVTNKAITEPQKAPQSVSTGSIEQIIINAANKYGLNSDRLVAMAHCESTLNPQAVNYNYYDNGHPSGLFQHISGYWPARASKYGYAGASVFDAIANANVTAAMIKDGLGYLWACKY